MDESGDFGETDENGEPPPHESRFRCADGDHSRCPHVPYWAALSVVNPAQARAMRAPPTAVRLCGCRCHADCPVATDVDAQRWPADCTCNGALEFVHDHESKVSYITESGAFDLFASIRDSAVQGFRETEARRAARRRGTGRGPEEIRRIIVDEYHKRGMEPPKQNVLDGLVNQIAQPLSLAERAEVHLRLGRDLIGLPFRLRRTFEGGLSGYLERSSESDGKLFEIAIGDGGYLPVEVDPNRVPELERMAANAVLFPSFGAVTRLELRTGSNGRVEVWPPPMDNGVRPIGLIPTSEASRFLQLLAAAGRVDQPCVCLALVRRSRDDAWELVLPRPLEPPPDNDR